MLLQSTLYSRLGIPHLANVHCELLLDCYGASCPIDEKLRAIGRQAFIVCPSILRYSPSYQVTNKTQDEPKRALR